MNTNRKHIIISVIALILVAGLSFFGGMKYAAAHPAARGAGQFGARGAGGTRSGAFQNGAGFTTGSVLSKDTNSITLSLRGGGSKIIFFSTSTQVLKSTSGTVGDLTTGDQLIVTGNQNSDGSLTASSIQIRPATGAGM